MKKIEYFDLTEYFDSTEDSDLTKDNDSSNEDKEKDNNSSKDNQFSNKDKKRNLTFKKIEQLTDNNISDEDIKQLRIKNLNSTYELGDALHRQANYKEAESLLKDTLEKRKQILGEEHHDTVSSMVNFIVLLYNQGKYIEAKALYDETKKKKIYILGSYRNNPMLYQISYNKLDCIGLCIDQIFNL